MLFVALFISLFIIIYSSSLLYITIIIIIYIYIYNYLFTIWYFFFFYVLFIHYCLPIFIILKRYSVCCIIIYSFLLFPTIFLLLSNIAYHLLLFIVISYHTFLLFLFFYNYPPLSNIDNCHYPLLFIIIYHYYLSPPILILTIISLVLFLFGDTRLSPPIISPNDYTITLVTAFERKNREEVRAKKIDRDE